MKNYLFKTSKTLRTTRALSLLIVLVSSLLINFNANSQDYFYVGPTNHNQQSHFSYVPDALPIDYGGSPIVLNAANVGNRSFAGHYAEFATHFYLYPADLLDPGIDLITSVSFHTCGAFYYGSTPPGGNPETRIVSVLIFETNDQMFPFGPTVPTPLQNMPPIPSFGTNLQS